MPLEFDDDLVTKQLRYCGMLETTRIRREGYAYRPTFGDFLARFDLYRVLPFIFLRLYEQLQDHWLQVHCEPAAH